ncbi:MFS transporter, partial [Streptomyces himastatinicus]
MLHRAIKRRKNPPLRRTDITVTEEKDVHRAVKAAALGNAMEWFDFGIYSYLAVTIGKVFFPGGNATIQVLSSFATFAVAFLVRPLGGMFFGPLGDRIGRKKVLSFTMIMMATSTLAIGLIPGYHSIGYASPALLILFRMLQGFSTGGEYGGASTFIAEYAPDKRRGFFGSFLEFGTLIGYTAAAGLVTILTVTLSDDTMMSWGWRIPFLAAAPIGLVGLYLRLKLDETPAFQKLEEEASAAHERTTLPFWQVFRTQWRAMVLCMALVAAYNITDYMLLSYMPTYLSSTLHYSETKALVSIIIVMLVLMASITFVGRLSDRVGRKPALLAGSIGF